MSNFYTEPFVSAGEMEFPSQPYITAQPHNHTATGPEDYVLTVIAAGAVSYQWEVFDGVSWSTIPGATSENLAITIDPSMNGWRYRVLVTGADGSTVTSKAAQIAVKGVHEITLEGAIIIFTGPARIKSLEVDINPVQSGQGDPSPDNIRPISGWDAVNVFVRGINQWDEEWESGAVNGSNGNTYNDNTKIRSKNFIRVMPSTAYYLKAPSILNYAWYDANKNYISGITSASPNYARMSPSDAAYLKFCCNGTTYNNDISINYPSTDHNYHSYQGDTYPISLGQTVYGGVLDVTSGVLTVDKAIADLGDLDWTLQSVIFYAPIPQMKLLQTVGSANALCSQYSVYPTTIRYASVAASTLSDKQVGISYDTSQPFVYVKDSAYTDATAFKTAMDGVQLVCELATPQTITLTPTEVTTLTGVNNIWADSGDISVTIIR